MVGDGDDEKEEVEEEDVQHVANVRDLDLLSDFRGKQTHFQSVGYDGYV